jgi:hypothetical protein
MATIGVLALGYGLVTSLDLLGPSEASATTGSGTLSTNPSAHRQTPAGAEEDFRPVIGVVPATTTVPDLNTGWSDPVLTFESWSDEPPVEIGEPLDPDDPLNAVMAMADEEPVGIGPPLDADNPSAWQPEESSEAPIELGEPLNADDPEAWQPERISEEVIEIGYELDPDDPWGWVPDDAPDEPIEIGEFLPVEGPST